MYIIIYILLGAHGIYYKKYEGLPVRYLYTDEIKTGDIFLVSYSNPMRFFGDGIIGLNFVHACIAVEHENDIHILEYSNYFNEQVGFLKIPFSKWLKYNKNGLILVNKLKTNRDRNMLKEKFLKFREDHFFETNLDFYGYLFRRFFSDEKEYEEFDPERHNNYVCYEIILSMLQEAKMIESGAMQKYSTDDFIGMKGIKLKNDVDYSEYFVVDPSYLME